MRYVDHLHLSGSAKGIVVHRRKFLGLTTAILAIGAAGMFSFNTSLMRTIYYKIRNRLAPPSGPKQDSEREEALLPAAGVSTSVETALNSRCTSDYDDNPYYFHWGMFDKDKKLSQAQIERILHQVRIPRFTDKAVEIRPEKHTLTFLIDNRLQSLQRNWAMVECGMQHQAVGLVCTALGAGYAFNDFLNGGKAISADRFATIQIKLDAVKPSYDGAYWSKAAPSKTKPWKSGTLSDPVRQGGKPLLATLAGLKTRNDMGRHITSTDLSQLLWAARGRTPHYHISQPWGMTIPTYHGQEGKSEVSVISDGKLAKYINWKNDQPTHSLEATGKIDSEAAKLLTDHYKSSNCFIVLSRNENKDLVYWEIGYQLLNLMLQADSLGVGYYACLLDEKQKKPFLVSGVKDPVAVVALNTQKPISVL